MSTDPGLRAVPDPLPQALEAATRIAPWTREGPGPLGLLNALLRYLAEVRRAAGPAGEARSYRTVEEIHRAAGAAHGMSPAHTRSALFELEAYGIVVAAVPGDDPVSWRATDAGVAAVIAAAQPARRA